MSITVLLADDHEAIRFGMMYGLQGKHDIEVVGEAASGEQALDLADKLHPNVILLDMGMPGVSGGTLIAKLLERHPQTRVLVLSMYSDQARVVDAFQAGARGYVLKENSIEEVALGIREVAGGRKYVTPKLVSVLADGLVEGSSSLRTQLAKLTDREREVIELASQGLTSAQIADQLFISPRTVETHRGHAMDKLGLHNEVELVRFFVQVEMLEPSQ
jgi:DNA-binding NarL/FixJ family response regulator